jgi:hypothetical protein
VNDMTIEKKKMSLSLRGTLAALLLAGVLAGPSPAAAQQAFATPAAAADALVDGLARNDDAALRRVLGAGYQRFLPQASTSVEDRYAFLEAWARAHRIVDQTGDSAMLEVGTHGWTLPIPIVKTGAGWRFDTRSAPAEMRTRRIGRNELAAIQVALAYTDAQEEYFERNPDGRSPKHFAKRALSSPGRRDGLYWAARPDERDSPLGAAFALARPGQPYHGYLFRTLNAQGDSAPGGAKDYVRNGLMTEGFALIAWPARYGDTGVMSFIVSRDGIVHQKNLGPDTGSVVKRISAYDPGAGWERVTPPR